MKQFSKKSWWVAVWVLMMQIPGFWILVPIWGGGASKVAFPDTSQLVLMRRPKDNTLTKPGREGECDAPGC